jgi:hypothetical protein
MDPNVWGKYMWTTLHFVALGYPDDPNEKHKQNFYNFYSNIYQVLPCKQCGHHLEETLQKTPLYPKHLVNKTELFKWTVDLHNIVNKRLGKKILTLDEATSIYMYKKELYNSMCGKDPLAKTQIVETFKEEEEENYELFSDKHCFMLMMLLVISILINVYYVIKWK